MAQCVVDAGRRLALGFALSISACALGAVADERGRPVASLADSTDAERAFERIRTGWARNDPADRASFRQAIDAFVTRFPSDGLTPLARVYGALSLMDAPEDWPEAERRIDAMSAPPLGSTHDLYLVALAKIRRHHHRPDAAFELLRPIVGNIVDTRARALLQEELTFDALEARQPYEAIAYMDAWLRASTEDDRNASEGKVSVALGAVPEVALRGSLEAMRASAKARQSHGYGAVIERLVGDRLGQIAVDRGDAALARWLLDSDSGPPLLGEEIATQLGRLATSRRGIGSVVGRTVGLVLPTSSPDLRDEAADVLRGVLSALELDEGHEGGASRVDGLRLVTRDDGGDVGRLRSAMEEVLGEGATVIVTALDAPSAAQAFDWAAAAQVDVIVLATPATAGGARPASGFSVGEAWPSELAALALALKPPPAKGARAGAASSVVTVADVEAMQAVASASAAPQSPWHPPIGCDAVPLHTRAGESRFPVASWAHEGVDRWLVAGSPACAADLLDGLAHVAPPSSVVGLSLEAASVDLAAPVRARAGIRVVRASAGAYPVPSARPDDPRAAAIRAMLGRTGAKEAWWAAVGHDAAVLARAALSKLPLDVTTDPDAIEQRRAQAHQALEAAHAPLWTSERDGFDAAHDLPRTVRVVELDR